MLKMETEKGVPGDFGLVCVRKKARRKRQKILIIDMLLDFAKNTTLHGLRYVTERGLTIVEKIFWMITFIVSVALCFILIYKVWYKWLNSPVIVSFSEKMVSVREVPFPSVTICPQIKCNKHVYNYSGAYKSYYRKYAVTNFSKVQQINDTILEEIKMFEDAMLVCNNDLLRSFLLPRNTTDKSQFENLDKISQPLEESFPLPCLWQNKEIDCRKIFTKVLTREGICFNFNTLSSKEIFRTENIQKDYPYLIADKSRKWWSAEKGYFPPKDEKVVYPRRGRENGAYPDLIVFLAVNKSNYDEMCNSISDGFKIYVQHPTDMPQSSLYYYAAIPTQVSSLALKFSILNTSESLRKYDSEVRQCYFPEDKYLRYFNIYTPHNCQLECLSNYTYKRCGCVVFYMPHDKGDEICTLSKKACAMDALDELASLTSDSMECNCLPSCDNVQYDAEILKTTFNYSKALKAYYKMYDVPDDQSKFIDEYDFSQIEIYFKEPRFVSMRRSELFGVTDFLANCGGLLGLFLGFSFLSLVEIFYFCTLRLWCMLKRDIKAEKKGLHTK